MHALALVVSLLASASATPATPAPPVHTTSPAALPSTTSIAAGLLRGDRLAGLSPALFARAVRAYERVHDDGHARGPMLAVIDYSLPSTQRRLWVFDMARGALLFHELVAHGRGSGDLVATRFSNVSGSLMTSLGVFTTGGCYVGKHGRSLRLQGLDVGLNDNAAARAVVIHAAAYVSDDVVRAQGRLGRSWGCPALDPRVAPAVINALQDGAVVVAWGDAPALLQGSRYLAG